MKKYKVKYIRGKEEYRQPIVHADGIIQPADMSLCGSDLMGDEYLGWYAAEETNDKINCKDCIAIIKHCQSYKI